MFAFLFLIIGAVFLAALFLTSRLLPDGKWRLLFILSVLAVVVAYPYLHLVLPSYHKFKQLCIHPSPPTIVKTKAVDFILINGGFPSDCTEGPAYIENLGYLGFDCRKRTGENRLHQLVTTLYRYTKRPGTSSDCGLDCFDVKEISSPETKFGPFYAESRTRAGYLAGDERRVTTDFPVSNEKQMPFWRWLRFNDSILADGTEGDMAYTTNYYYLPYGPLRILGLASGGAPAEECPRNPAVDPRNVYIPKSSDNEPSARAANVGGR